MSFTRGKLNHTRVSAEYRKHLDKFMTSLSFTVNFTEEVTDGMILVANLRNQLKCCCFGASQLNIYARYNFKMVREYIVDGNTFIDYEIRIPYDG